MFLGLPDPHPDPLVTSTDPTPDQAKKVKKTLISTVLYFFLSLKNDINVPEFLIRIRIRMFLGLPDPHPDQSVRDPDKYHQNIKDPQH